MLHGGQFKKPTLINVDKPASTEVTELINIVKSTSRSRTWSTGDCEDDRFHYWSGTRAVFTTSGHRRQDQLERESKSRYDIHEV